MTSAALLNSCRAASSERKIVVRRKWPEPPKRPAPTLRTLLGVQLPDLSTTGRSGSFRGSFERGGERASPQEFDPQRSSAPGQQCGNISIRFLAERLRKVWPLAQVTAGSREIYLWTTVWMRLLTASQACPLRITETVKNGSQKIALLPRMKKCPN